MDQSQIDHLKGAIEALLFVSEKPVTLDQIKQVLETVTPGEIQKLVSSLQDDYRQKDGGTMIVEIAGGFQMLSNSKYASYIRSFYKTRQKEKLSRPALETLAIIAYKQPVSRADVEVIRGVNSDGVFAHLLNKSLIKIVGRKEVPGRPFIYGTTKEFLEYFGLKSLEDMPKLEEFPTILTVDSERPQPIAQTVEEVAAAQAELATLESAAAQQREQETSSGEVPQQVSERMDDSTVYQESSGQSRLPIEERMGDGNANQEEKVEDGS